jgi:hypothetical protein
MKQEVAQMGIDNLAIIRDGVSSIIKKVQKNMIEKVYWF